MPRRPKPRLHQEWYVTEAGGPMVKLCRAEEGMEAAETALARHLEALGRESAPEPAAGVLTVAEAVAVFMRHAETYYRLPSGEQSSEVKNFNLSFRELLTRFGPTPAASFDRRGLKHVRDDMIAAGLSRKIVNQRIGRIIRAFRWLAEEHHIPDSVAASLTLLRNLQAHRSAAPETEPIKPVSADDVRRTLDHLSDPWRSMVLVQWHTGMRPGEVCNLRLSMLSSFGRHQLIADFGKLHKMAYKGKPRVVVIGQSATSILARWIVLTHVRGIDPLFTSRRCRTKPAITTSFDHELAKACLKAGVDWAPNQLRHSYATRVRAIFGLDAAQVALGQSKADVTQIYAEVDLSKRDAVARRLG